MRYTADQYNIVDVYYGVLAFIYNKNCYFALLNILVYIAVYIGGVTSHNTPSLKHMQMSWHYAIGSFAYISITKSVNFGTDRTPPDNKYSVILVNGLYFGLLDSSWHVVPIVMYLVTCMFPAEK